VLDGTHGSPERTGTGVPVLSAQNVVNGKLDAATNRFTSETEYNAFRKRLSIRREDVLLTIVGTIGRVAVVEEEFPAVFQRSVAVLRVRSELASPRYVFHALQSQDVKRQLARATNQSTQAGVYLGRLKEVVIPLPPLAEQRRIAEVLDKADALRAKRRQAIAKLDALPHSLFIEMFGDPVTRISEPGLPAGWHLSTVAGVCALKPNASVGGPFGSDLTQADYVPEPGVPVVRGQNLSGDVPELIEDGYVYVSEAKALSLESNLELAVMS
jgi:type I restriction enzyme S subunit